MSNLKEQERKALEDAGEPEPIGYYNPQTEYDLLSGGLVFISGAKTNGYTEPLYRRGVSAEAAQAPASGEVEPVCLVRKNDSGQVYLCNPDGTAFQPYNYIGADFYTHPPAKVPEGENAFGLDARYFHEKLRLILRDISSYTPSEMARALGRLAITASDVTMREAEFQIGDLADQPKYRDTTPTPATTPAAEWVKDVIAERKRQDEKWGGPEHDDQKSPNDFVQHIEDYAGWARVMAGMGSFDKYRRRMIQVAALAGAAVEAADRATARTPPQEQ